jgi:acetyltransferase-like isoleucine patch superfamily enzyme
MASSLGNWESVQRQYADVPGEEGVALRREHYTPFFLRLGRDVMIEEGCRFYHPDRIVLDDDVRINIGALVYGSGGVRIGRHARIGPRCFIHSANHDIDESPFAFHERGYREAPVSIGDNVLVSANVSVLPGAQVEDASFIGCGAVVPAGQYPVGARLFGVPARNRRADDGETVQGAEEDAPEIVFLVPEGCDYWRDVAMHILTPLRLPQVAVMGERGQLPASAHSAVVLGPEGWLPEADVDLWRVCSGSVQEDAGGVNPAPAFTCSNGAEIVLPTEHGLTVIRDGCSAYPLAGHIEQSLFWLLERLIKGSGPLSYREFREWIVTLHILDLQPNREDQLLEIIQGELDRRRPPRKNRFFKTLKNAISRYRSPENVRGGTTRLLPTRQVILGSPVILVEKILENAESRCGATVEDFQRLAEELLQQATAAQPMLAVGIAAALLDDGATIQAVRKWFATHAWLDPNSAFPRATTEGGGLCYSPLVLAWHVVLARRTEPGFILPEGAGQPRKIPQRLQWARLENGGLLDYQRRQISRSLVDNWLTLHKAPLPAGTQYRLTKADYQPAIARLEAAWFEVLRSIQAEKGRPLVRLRPWPAGYNAAMSLRYDVDRPISADRIRELVGIQSRVMNAPCASWYYFANDPKQRVQSRVLWRHGQEIGLHVAEALEARAATGITHHSAPTADYWRGDGTNTALDNVDADYGEFLATRTPTPRPAWIADRDGERLGGMWITPLHFPLEGSTSEETLAYFDLLRDDFREALTQGGHIIIGTHPDLNQDLLDALAERESLLAKGVWFATVRQVVDRCRRVAGNGAITTARAREDDRLLLKSRFHIADLSVEVWSPGENDPSVITVQLTPGRARPLEDSPDKAL